MVTTNAQTDLSKTHTHNRAEKMTDEPIRPSEDPLLVFISSRQDEELSVARGLAIKEVERYPGMKAWAFEDAPASSEQARDRYITNAGRADLVIWLIGSTTTTPIVEEVSACMRAQGKLLAFKLPAPERDDETESLIKRVSDYATWKNVENVEDLPAHIKSALTDEMLRRYRDPAPVNHDLFLKQKHRESIADTKRLWTTLGVPEDIAGELADDHSVGHKLTLPTTGMLTVNAQQGSGKTLAAQRLYQLALVNRLQDHSQPLPVFLNARNISGDLKDQIEGYTREQGTIYTQRVLVVIDGLDETGRHKANQLLNQAQSYTDANQNVAAVVMTRPLPGLKSAEGPFVLPECNEEEFLFIASKIAGRKVNRVEIPFREYQSRLPLFATMVGAYLRQPMPMQGRTPSQIVSEMVRRVLDDSLDNLGDTEEFLKKLAVASITSGESVEKALMASKASDQARIVDSRIVVEDGGKFDFTLAIFREWFAARALVERSVSLDDIELNSDMWVIPLAIAINSENQNIAPEIMEKIASGDPGMAGLVLEEVKHNWSTGEPSESLPSATAMEIGTRIRNAMENWEEGLGPLMSALGMLDESGSVLTLGIDARPGWVTTSWYRGDKALAPVVQLPEDLHDLSKGHFWDWPGWTSRGIESTRVWPWSVTHNELSRSLSEQLKAFRLALDSTEGFHEFAYDFTSYLRKRSFEARDLQSSTDVINFIDKWLLELNRDPRGSVTFGYKEYAFTVLEQELFRERVSELSRDGTDILVDPWPGPDKEWPPGRSGGRWFEIYTEERLVQRTNAMFNGALRIYNHIVERWLPAFNKRNQMRYTLPFRMRGELRLLEGSKQNDRNEAVLIHWNEWADDTVDSGVFIEMGPKERTTDDRTQKRIQAAQEKFIEQGKPYYSSWGVLHGYEPRPATTLAHKWLTSDLNALHWAK